MSGKENPVPAEDAVLQRRSNDQEFFSEADEAKLRKKPLSEILLWEPRLRPIYVICLCLCLGVLFPIIINSVIPLGKQRVDTHKTCILKPEFRFECVPGKEITEAECESLQCCWRTNLDDLRAPRCFHSIPSAYTYRVISRNVSNGNQFRASFNILSTMTKTPFVTPASKHLKLTVEALSETHLNIKIYDPARHKVSRLSPSDTVIGDFTLTYGYENTDRAAVRVYRKSTNEKIFDTKYTSLIFSEDYLEISNMLPTKYLYGVGQGSYDSLQRKLDYRKWSIFNSDSSREKRKQGSHPFYMCIEETGLAHGIYLQNSYPMEIHLMPSPAIVYRVLGGYFNFHIFIGPSPNDVMDQYTNHIGRPVLPPYWSLGYHLCRDTGNETAFIAENGEMDKRTNHFDSDCIDEQLMGKLAFTLDKKLFVNISSHLRLLSSKGRKVFLSQFPQVAVNEDINSGGYPPYTTGMQDQLFVRDSSDSLFVGTFRDGPVAYPDFSDSNTFPWLSTHYHTLIQEMEVPFDGLTLISNAPYNDKEYSELFCKGEAYTYLPSHFYDSPSNGTICMNALQFNNRKHIEMHNLYGQQHQQRVLGVLHEISYPIRKLVMSEATYPGSGKYGGFYGGDYTADWWQMKQSIIQVLEYGLYGIPLNGVPICGSLDTNFIFPNETELYEELCLRWHQLGSFYPFARNIFKADQHPRSPVHFTKHFSKWVNIYIEQRYSLLPYYYTLLYQSNQHGTPVLRPLFFEFPFDKYTYSIDEQFMIGSALLVSPVLYPGRREIQAYFPECLWYDYKMGSLAYHNSTTLYSGRWGLLQSLEDEINVHMRGGSIIAALIPGETAEETRHNNYTLIAALDCKASKKPCASGELYMDDGISQNSMEDGDYYHVTFTATQNSVLIYRTSEGTLCFKQSPLSTVINFLRVYGVMTEPHTIKVTRDDEILKTNGQIHYEEDIAVLTVLSINIDWCKGKTFIASWE